MKCETGNDIWGSRRKQKIEKVGNDSFYDKMK
jgi:hypothetical protein